jgi:hypothetical protein
VACSVAIKNSDSKIFFIVITVELIFNLDDYLEQDLILDPVFLEYLIYYNIDFFCSIYEKYRIVVGVLIVLRIRVIHQLISKYLMVFIY